MTTRLSLHLTEIYQECDICKIIALLSGGLLYQYISISVYGGEVEIKTAIKSLLCYKGVRHCQTVNASAVQWSVKFNLIFPSMI